MSANWVDFVLGLLFLLVIAIEAKRGFGKSLFDFAAALITLRFAGAAHPYLLPVMQFSASPNVNSAIIYCFLVMVLGIISFFICKIAQGSVDISLDNFDHVMGACFGFLIWIAVAHAFTQVVFYAGSKGGAMPAALSSSLFGTELYGFTTYHSIIDFLKGLTG